MNLSQSRREFGAIHQKPVELLYKPSQQNCLLWGVWNADDTNNESVRS